MIFLNFSDFSNVTIAKLISKNKFLTKIKPHVLKKSIKTLKELEFHSSDIKTHTKILLQSSDQLRNNFQRLNEVGFNLVTAHRLTNCKQIMSNSVHFNQCFHFLPKDIDIVQNIFTVANVPIEVDQFMYKPTNELNTVHRIAFNLYMQKRALLTDAEIVEILRKFPSIKSRSIRSIEQTVQLLENAFDAPVRAIPRFLLQKQPNEIKQMLDLKYVCDIDIRTIIRLQKSCSVEQIQANKIVLDRYNVPYYSVKRYKEVFCMHPETLSARLETLSNVSRSSEFMQHVGVAKLLCCMGQLEKYANSNDLEFSTMFNERFIE